MKANELRVNNWIERKFWNPRPNNPSFMWDKCTVDAIYAGRVNCRLDKSTVIKLQYEDIRPIPLTPELLDRCGFVISGDAEWVMPLPNGNGCDLFLEHVLADNTIPYDVVLRTAKHFIYLHSITYLHQLQNLFFSLTGNELEVKM